MPDVSTAVPSSPQASSVLTRPPTTAASSSPALTSTTAPASQSAPSSRSTAATAEEDDDLVAAIALSLEGGPVTVKAEQRRDVKDTQPAYQTTNFSGAPPEQAAHRGAEDLAEKTALDSLSEIAANCEATGEVFIDPTFRPDLRSLYANGRCRKRDADRLAIVQHYQTGQGNEIQWLNPGEILQRPDDLQMQFDSTAEMLMTMKQFARVVEWRVFQNDPLPEDISQGGLGNCWFCGSLAAVADKPKLIRRLFVDPFSKAGERSPIGAYLIRLCDGGEWQYIIIDGLLPCNRYGMLAFSGARRNQLWVPLLEKAYAKRRGFYEAIEGGIAGEGLRLFTGWPSIVQDLQTVPGQSGAEDNVNAEEADLQRALRTQAHCRFVGEDLLWTRLVSAYDCRLIMCGSCGHIEGISDEQYRATGLSPSHCYSIVRVASAAHGTLRLLKLRNPWGTGLKWKGRFSDDDESWTPAIKAEVGADDLGSSGVFWMTLQDVRKYFTSITICSYREGWSEFRHTTVFPQYLGHCSQPAFLLTASEKNGPGAELLLSIMQPQEQASSSDMTADAGLAVYKLKTRSRNVNTDKLSKSLQDCKFIDSAQLSVQDTLVSDSFLAADESMLVVPLCFNQRSANHDGFGCEKRFTFACFASRPLSAFRELEISPEVYRDAAVAYLRHRGKRNRLQHSFPLYLTQCKDNGMIVLVENASLECIVFETQWSDLFNITFSRGLQSESGSFATRDMIPPMHGMIIVVAAAMPSGHTYRYGHVCSVYRGPQTAELHEPQLAELGDVFHTPFFLEGI